MSSFCEYLEHSEDVVSAHVPLFRWREAAEKVDWKELKLPR